MNKKYIYLLSSILAFGSIAEQVIAAPRNNNAKSGETCQLPNKEDSYKLAVSWQPAFCETHRGKPECKITDSKVYQASHFTLHGLWPNKKECGIDYGLCGKYKQQVRSFCDYEPVPMKAETMKTLGEVMPSVAQGSCLDRHEWYKHGTCQVAWDADQYFGTAVRLVKEFNDKGMSQFMVQNTGKKVATEDFLKALDKAFGQNARKRINLGCDKQGNLVDLFITLPKDIPTTAALADLIQKAPENFSNRCGESFSIDPIGYAKK